MRTLRLIVLCLCVAVPIYAVVPCWRIEYEKVAMLYNGDFLVIEDGELTQDIWFGRITKQRMQVKKGDILPMAWWGGILPPAKKGGK